MPRILWPDKPNVTRFGPELYSIVFNNPDPSSALSAYLHGGGLLELRLAGCLAVSVLLGLELGWLSRRWFEFVNGTKPGMGILIFTVPAALFAFWVETWIAASYVGGFVTLVILIKLCDLVTTRRAVPLPQAEFSRRAVRR